MTSVRLRLWALGWRLRRLAGPSGASPGQFFPAFRLDGLDGAPHDVPAPATVTLVWLTNLCEDCRARIPRLNGLLDEHPGRLAVRAVSVLGADRDTPMRVAAAHGLRFPLLLDPEDAVCRRLGWTRPDGACPLYNLLLVDAAGRVAFRHHLSAVKDDDLRARVRKVLGPPGTLPET